MTRTTLALAEPAIDYGKTIEELNEGMMEAEDAYQDYLFEQFAKAAELSSDIICQSLSSRYGI